MILASFVLTDLCRLFTFFIVTSIHTTSEGGWNKQVCFYNRSSFIMYLTWKTQGLNLLSTLPHPSGGGYCLSDVNWDMKEGDWLCDGAHNPHPKKKGKNWCQNVLNVAIFDLPGEHGVGQKAPEIFHVWFCRNVLFSPQHRECCVMALGLSPGDMLNLWGFMCRVHTGLQTSKLLLGL